jgi:hypothetical protein
LSRNGLARAADTSKTSLAGDSPSTQTVRSGDRATEFRQCCCGLGIKGISLHSYRYAWAERAKQCGYPERFAQEARGHNSKAVHRAYARRAIVKLPSLESYEKKVTESRNNPAPWTNPQIF